MTTSNVHMPKEDVVNNHRLSSSSDTVRVSRMWREHIVGLFILSVCITCFVMSYTHESHFKETTGHIEEVMYGDSVKHTECKSDGTATRCTTMNTVKCSLRMVYQDVGTERPNRATLQAIYEDGSEPAVGDSFVVFYDSSDPSQVVQHKITDMQRLILRIAALAVGVIAMIVIGLNITYTNNKVPCTHASGIRSTRVC